jgi:hypothetical protein
MFKRCSSRFYFESCADPSKIHRPARVQIKHHPQRMQKGAWRSPTGTPSAPPPEAYPTVTNGILVSIRAYQQMFPRRTGMSPPDHPFVPVRLNFGRQFGTRGIIDQLPPIREAPYAVLVPKPDSDGTDIAGLRPVEVSVPLGTYTGWNSSSADTGFGCAFDRFEGAFQPNHSPAPRANVQLPVIRARRSQSGIHQNPCSLIERERRRTRLSRPVSCWRRTSMELLQRRAPSTIESWLTRRVTSAADTCGR